MKIHRFPRLIDIHVHLRDPGETYKEDFESGTRAAIAGGFTAVFDMPNNKIPILTKKKLEQKISISKKKIVCDVSFFFGTDGQNTQEFVKVADRVVGLKIYLNQTTGNLLVDDERFLSTIFKAWPKHKPIMIHTEDSNIDFTIDLMRRNGNKVHITHVNTKYLLSKIQDAKSSRLPITCDVSPHHLLLTREDLAYLDNRVIVKPPLASQSDVDYLWDNIRDIDCIASDHAPHTLTEKKSFDPPSGVPGLETMLPLLLTAFHEGRITLEDIEKKLHRNPIKIFDIPAESDTYTQVDLEEEYFIEEHKLYTKCKWSPFVKRNLKGRVKRVVIRGTVVFDEGKVLVTAGFGKHIL